MAIRPAHEPPMQCGIRRTWKRPFGYVILGPRCILTSLVEPSSLLLLIGAEHLLSGAVAFVWNGWQVGWQLFYGHALPAFCIISVVDIIGTCKQSNSMKTHLGGASRIVHCHLFGGRSFIRIHSLPGQEPESTRLTSYRCRWRR